MGWTGPPFLAVGVFLLALGGGAVVAEPQATPRDLDICKLMPVADVSRILAASVGVGVTTAQSSVGGGCSYRDIPPKSPRVRLLIDFTDHGAPDRARAALNKLRQMFSERALATADVAGLGDEAFTASDGDTEGVKVRRGGYMGQVNVDVENASPVAVRDAARRLAAEALTRLP